MTNAEVRLTPGLDLTKALHEFKKQLSKNNILRGDRAHYTKPSIKKRQKSARARKRHGPTNDCNYPKRIHYREPIPASASAANTFTKYEQPEKY